MADIKLTPKALEKMKKGSKTYTLYLEATGG